MGRLLTFSNDQLREAMAEGLDHRAIAARFGVRHQSVSERITKLEGHTAVLLPRVVIEAQQSVFDTRSALEANYKRCLQLLDSIEGNPLSRSDPLRVIEVILKHIRAGLDVLQTLYAVNEQAAFQDEVMAILDECEPGSRAKILKRLQQRRSLRSAFTEN